MNRKGFEPRTFHIMSAAPTTELLECSTLILVSVWSVTFTYFMFNMYLNMFVYYLIKQAQPSSEKLKAQINFV